jgi:cbb3-type cytochrome oxidase subunit 1
VQRILRRCAAQRTALDKREKTMSSRFIKQAVLWFLAAIVIGIYMAISGDHSFISVHAHFQLLGWVSMTLFALIYRGWPRLAESTLATAHFWLHSLGVPIGVGAVALIVRGHELGGPVSAAGSVMILVGAIFFAIRVFNVVSDSQPAVTPT